MTPEVLTIEFAWAAWYASWVVAAQWADRAAKRPSLFRSLLPYAFEFTRFASLLGIYIGPHGPLTQLWALPRDAGWVLVGIAVLGFAFAWWARLVLGRLWSGFITRKENHHIVETGPYAIVRHPIYSGLLVAAMATVAIKGTAIAAAGAALLFLGWYVKAKVEESFLQQELGVDVYDAYRRRVPMIVPFL